MFAVLLTSKIYRSHGAKKVEDPPKNIHLSILDVLVLTRLYAIGAR